MITAEILRMLGEREVSGLSHDENVKVMRGWWRAKDGLEHQVAVQVREAVGLARKRFSVTVIDESTGREATGEKAESVADAFRAVPWQNLDEA